LPGLSLGLLRQPDFLRLWLAGTISDAGSGVSYVAIPLTAVLLLKATPTQMGLLGAAATTPALLLSLFIGVWVDRFPRRPILIAADLGRMLLLALIPLSAILGFLRMEVLYAVVLAAGTLTVLFDVAVTSYAPSLVRRDELVEANARLQVGTSAADVVGPGVAGWLIQAISAPIAIVVDALSFLASAALLRGIAAPEPRLPVAADRRSVTHEIVEGIQAVWNDRILRPMILVTAIGSFGGSVQQAVYVLYATSDLKIAPATLGLIFASGGLAALAGAGLAGVVGRRGGPGAALLWGVLVVAVGTAVVPLAGAFPGEAAPIFVLAQVLARGGLTVFSVNQISLRQAITPPSLLGRVNATRRVVVFGIRPIGSVLGGVLGADLGLQAVLFVGAGLAVLATVVGFLSPLRSIRQPTATA